MMTTEPIVALLVHGGPDSVEAARARGLASKHPPDKVSLLFREGSRWSTAGRWSRELERISPGLLYVINTAMPGALLACWWRRRHRVPFVLDTGDVVYEMARSSGITPAWKWPALKVVEALAQRMAHTIVVRGVKHAEYLRQKGHERVALIRDGYQTKDAPSPVIVEALRKRLGLADKFVVGIMGSLVFSPRLGICYGWDLIEALAELRDLPIQGLIIGDGNGEAWLRRRAGELGVAERVTFCGRIPYEEVSAYLRLMDVALSTQTNNLPGQVRTTGKLPEYMAAGRFILASRVGDAAVLLPETMLLDFAGEVDREYPRKLAARLRLLWRDRTILEARQTLPAMAAENCSYEVLSKKFNAVVAGITARQGNDEG